MTAYFQTIDASYFISEPINIRRRLPILAIEYQEYQFFFPIFRIAAVQLQGQAMRLRPMDLFNQRDSVNA
jgi:hypothetical protein